MDRLHRLTHEKRRLEVTYTNKFAWSVLPDGSWKGKPCFIVGGGPSLTKFNWDLLKGKLTIAINRAYEKFEPTIIFGMDPSFVRWVLMGKYGDSARTKFLQSSAMKIWVNTSGIDLPDDVYILKCWRNYLEGRRAFPLTMKEGIGHGNNSGYGALNLAACLGANPIYLLGYDMKRENGRTHWHNGHPKQMPEHVPDSFKKHFAPVAEVLRRQEITVINLNPESALDCFPKMKPSTAFEPPVPKAKDGGKTYTITDIKQPVPKAKDSDKMRAIAHIEPETLAIADYEYREAYDSKKLIRHEHDSLYFKGCHGFGDNFYQRQVIKDLAKTYKTVYLKTALPELYWDLPNVKFIYPNSMFLRTQQKHMKTLPAKIWSPMPEKKDALEWAQVGPPAAKVRTKYVELENEKDFDFLFPVKNAWIEAARKLVETLPLNGKKLCIIRRPTLRTEWNCPTRNPRIEYYQMLINRYKCDYFYLGLADILEKEEWFDGELHGIDKEFNKGEVPLTTIFGLMKIADMTITYPSFFMIAAIAIRATCFCIFGGAASPDLALRKNLGFYNFGFVAPTLPCNCIRMEHDCNKEIPSEKLFEKFEKLRIKRKYIKRISVGTPRGLGDVHWVVTKLESFKEKNAIDKLTLAIRKIPTDYYAYLYLKLIPFIDEVYARKTNFYFTNLWDKSDPHSIVKDVEGVDYLIDFGGFMYFKDTALYEIHPEYETNYSYPINIPKKALDYATKLKIKNKGKLILFYASSMGANGNLNNGAWEIKNWITLAQSIYNHTGVHPILIGADADSDYAAEINKLDKRNIIQNFVGKTDIYQVLALIKNSNLLVAFPSGLPIMAMHFKIPTVIFWPIRGISRAERYNSAFQYAWVSPEMRANGRYIPVIYDDPNTNPIWIFNKIRKFL